MAFSDYIEQLRQMKEDGMLFLVGWIQGREDVLVPQFLIRSHLRQELIELPIAVQIDIWTSKYQDIPLVIFHFRFFDKPTTIDEVELFRGLTSYEIRQGSPYEMENYLNPTDPEDRRMLKAIVDSKWIFVHYFHSTMHHEADRAYPALPEQKRVAEEVLQETEQLAFIPPERFVKAIEWYQETHAL